MAWCDGLLSVVQQLGLGTHCYPISYLDDGVVSAVRVPCATPDGAALEVEVCDWDEGPRIEVRLVLSDMTPDRAVSFAGWLLHRGSRQTMASPAEWDAIAERLVVASWTDRTLVQDVEICVED